MESLFSSLIYRRLWRRIKMRFMPFRVTVVAGTRGSGKTELQKSKIRQMGIDARLLVIDMNNEYHWLPILQYEEAKIFCQNTDRVGKFRFVPKFNAVFNDSSPLIELISCMKCGTVVCESFSLLSLGLTQISSLCSHVRHHRVHLILIVQTITNFLPSLYQKVDEVEYFSHLDKYPHSRNTIGELLRISQNLMIVKRTVNPHFHTTISPYENKISGDFTMEEMINAGGWKAIYGNRDKT